MTSSSVERGSDNENTFCLFYCISSTSIYDPKEVEERSSQNDDVYPFVLSATILIAGAARSFEWHPSYLAASSWYIA